MTISAMKQALEALDSDDPSIQLRAAVVLRQAIEQAEKQEPVAWIVDGGIKVRLDMAGKLYYSESNVYGKDVVDEAIEQEREACAKVAEEVMRRYKADTALDPDLNKVGAMAAELCALWIRKRGEK